MCETDVNNRSFDSFLADELAPFSMRDQGGSRSPSPIEITPNSSLNTSETHSAYLDSTSEDKEDLQKDCDLTFVSVEDVDTSISPQSMPSGQKPRESLDTLETIFEDILLETPPRKLQHTALIRKMVHRKYLEHSSDLFYPISPDSPSGSPLKKRHRDK